MDFQDENKEQKKLNIFQFICHVKQQIIEVDLLANNKVNWIFRMRTKNKPDWYLLLVPSHHQLRKFWGSQ